MCGIAAFFAKESVPDVEVLETFIEGVRKRGADSLEMVILDDPDNYPKAYRYRYNSELCEEHSRVQDMALDLHKHLRVGSLCFICARAIPETETQHPVNQQPIVSDDCILVHNGSVTDSEFVENKEVDCIDSEQIIKGYVRSKRNMKEMMEKMSGSFAFVLYDITKKELYAVAGFNPLAHAYIRGVGYFLHSDNEVLGEVIRQITGASRDGMNVWEAWYHHYLEGYTITATDIDSGFQRHCSYKPFFLHPIYTPKLSQGTTAVVLASGGVDSGVTAAAIRHFGPDVNIVLLHFNYGQKGQECEEWAVKKIGDDLGCKVEIADLSEFYSKMAEGCLLLDDRIDTNLTGGKMLKSTIAWVPARNMVFGSLACAYAESLLVANKTGKVLIAAGWNQLSEETGGYPDNSFQFNKSLEQLAKYGTISFANIQFMPLLQRLTKTETWFLGDKIGFKFEHTVSCDNPILEWNKHYPLLCDSCGSTKLSRIAAARAGVVDKRQFRSNGPIEAIMETVNPNLDYNNIVQRLVWN